MGNSYMYPVLRTPDLGEAYASRNGCCRGCSAGSERRTGQRTVVVTVAGRPRKRPWWSAAVCTAAARSGSSGA